MREHALSILRRLKARYPDSASHLSWSSPWQLLVATVLSAQCTDKRVNQVTPEFFRRWPDPKSLSRAEPREVEEVIRSTGFYRNKAGNLQRSAQILVERHNAEVPGEMDQLLNLPGVARKTANIVLAGAFGKHEGIAVDTHVGRISYRLGLTSSNHPQRIEGDLMKVLPQSEWGRINTLMVRFGRDVCRAKSPACADCDLADICPGQGLQGTGYKDGASNRRKQEQS